MDIKEQISKILEEISKNPLKRSIQQLTNMTDCRSAYARRQFFSEKENLK